MDGALLLISSSSRDHIKVLVKEENIHKPTTEKIEERPVQKRNFK